MKRVTVLATLLMAGALSLAVTAWQPAAGEATQAAPKVVEVEKLRDNLFMLKGGGGNTAVFVGTTGVVVVDTKLPDWGRPVLEAIRNLTPKPITTIINTHTHGDHVSGNVEFPATVEVVVQENTAANMKEMRASTQTAPSGQPPNIFKANNGRGMPKKTFKDRIRSVPAPTASTSITSAVATLTATRGSCFRRCAPCTPATSSRARTSPTSMPSTAGAVSPSPTR